MLNFVKYALCLGLSSIICSLSIKSVAAESKCFENIHQLFKNESHTKNADYYFSNIKAPKSLPHIVAIRSRNSMKCVGVLISKRFIISSAVCLASPRQPVTAVWIGDIPTRNASVEYKKSNQFLVEQIILHPNYKQSQFFRNIGLLRLNRDIEFNSRRYPACLECDPIAPTEINLTLSNYFRNQERVPVRNYNVCNDYFDLLDVLKSEQFCAEIKGNCDYPSGSPLQRMHEELDKVYTVTGLLSFRKDCKMTESEVVFVRIGYFIKWIKDVVEGS